MARDADVAVPPVTAVAAETRFLPARRRRRFPWAPYGADPPGRGRPGRGPRLSDLQARPDLVRAVRPLRADPAPGPLDRARQLQLGAPRPRLLGHARAHDRLHDRQRRPDDRARHADRAPAPPHLRWRAGAADGRARARLGDAGRRRRAGLLLDDELRERRPQLPLRRAPPGRAEPRLVCDTYLEPRHGHAADRVGRAALHRDQRLRRPCAGSRTSSSRPPGSTVQGRYASSAT